MSNQEKRVIPLTALPPGSRELAITMRYGGTWRLLDGGSVEFTPGSNWHEIEAGCAISFSQDDGEDHTLSVIVRGENHPGIHVDDLVAEQTECAILSREQLALLADVTPEIEQRVLY